MRDAKPTFEEIKAKAVELYIKDKGEPPPMNLSTVKHSTNYMVYDLLPDI